MPTMGSSALPTTPWQPAQLQAAFADFEIVSERLAEHYGCLEQRVAELTRALHTSHAALETELADKGRLASRLCDLLDALPGGVVVLDGAGLIRQFNPAATELLGQLTRGQSWVTVVAQAFAPCWDDGHDISLRDGRRVNVATAACASEPGQILLLKDVTETRRLQEQLNHHRRLSAQTELAAVLAHQVRTPLATALLHLGNAQKSGGLTDPQARGTGKALTALRQLERLVEDMLSYARGSVINPDTFAATSLLQELVDAVSAERTDGGFTFEVASASQECSLTGNRSALLSIMLNLVENARHATQGHGHLLLTVELGASVVALVFTDNGPGIAPAHRAQIFEPFFTSHKTGTGLGLAVARSIARAHGGDLDLEVDHASGARFVLTLPLHSAPAAVSTGVN